MTARSLENIAVHHVQRYPGSVAHLRRLLGRRVARSVEVHGTDRREAAGWIEEVVAKLTRLGLLDDDSYALARARLLARRGKPERVIRLALAAKEVSGAAIDGAISGLRDELADIDLTAAVAFARRRRLGPFAGLEPPARDKQMAAFARAGFSLSVATTVLSATDPDDLIDRARARPPSIPAP